MKQINVFHKGIVSDLDYSKRSGDTWDFPSQNIRVLNHKKQGYIVTRIDGNELSFNIKTGFIALGACEYKGIIYIVSYNTSTENGEIGCFPSLPSRTSTTFVREYNPLFNLYRPSFPGIYNFSSDKLTLSLDHMVEMFARESYDESVNLYMCDYEHHNRVINTGFSINGGYNSNLYNIDELEKQILQIKSTDSMPIMVVDEISGGGSLRPGNYFIFLRYLSESFDRTHFLYELGPIQISPGNDMLSIEGIIDDGIINTGKKIELTIDNIDTSFSYIEFGIIRYSGEFGSNALNDVYLIDKYYDITSDSQTFVIYGNEDKNALTYGEIVKPSVNETICKSHRQSANRYWGANWKEGYYDKEKFQLLALSIKTTLCHKYIADVKRGDFYNFANTDNPNIIGQHKDYENTLYYTSHMRGEIYPYGIVFILTGGRETPAFPLLGKDFYGGSAAGAPTNNLGLFRFPAYNSDFDNDHFINDPRNVIGLGFNYIDFIQLLESDSAYNEIEGFYIARGDRIPNVYYQGYMVDCYNHIDNNYAQGYYTWNPASPSGGVPIRFGAGDATPGIDFYPAESESRYIPLYRGKMPINCDVTAYVIGDDPEYVDIAHGLGQEKKRLAVFSFDHMFEISDELGDNQEVYVRKLYSIVDNDLFDSTNSAITPDTFLFEIEPGSSNLTIEPDTAILATITNVDKAQHSAPNRFSAYFSDWLVDDERHAFAFAVRYDAGPVYVPITNRSIKTARYLGIIPDDDEDFSYTANAIVNVQRYQNATEYWQAVYNSFQIRNKNYFKVSEYQEIDEIKLRPTFCVYKGDVFLHRGFYRQQRWAHIPNEWDPAPLTLEYQHGLVVSMITENMNNLAMRNDVPWETDVDNGIYTYYPKSLDLGITKGDILQWGVLQDTNDYLEEAFYINSGYNKILGGRPFIGYDINYPVSSNIKPTRVRHSAQHVPGAYFDGYRLFDEANYIDVDISSGQINAIREELGNLLTVHDDGIHRLFIENQRSEIEMDQNKLVIGRGAIIDNDTLKIADFGSQHQWSVMKTDFGIYGWDFKRAVLWRVSYERSGFGNIYFVAHDISKEFQIKSYVKEITTSYDPYTDVINNLPDTPALSSGLYTSFNRKNNEVYFTFLNNAGSSLTSPGEDSTTIIFSELINAFTSTTEFYPQIAFNIYDNFYTSKDSNEFYIHDVDGNKFYGNDMTMKLSLVVNGSGVKGNPVFEEKMYNSFTIEMPDSLLYRVDLETEVQDSFLYPFVDGQKFWMNPEYLGNKWYVPINVQESALNQQYNEESSLMGTYLKITLTYLDEDSIFIKNIITDFNIITN